MEGTTPECGPPEGRRLRCKVPVRICALGDETRNANPRFSFVFSEAASSWRSLMHSLKRIFAGPNGDCQ